ncbi:MAG: hypothetical protein ACQESG_03150 [Nanobdellota archaeon]
MEVYKYNFEIDDEEPSTLDFSVYGDDLLIGYFSDVDHPTLYI